MEILIKKLRQIKNILTIPLLNKLYFYLHMFQQVVQYLDV